MSDDELLFPWIQKQIGLVLRESGLEKKDLINLGIGDTCHPLPSCITDALHSAIELMGKQAVGYGDERGSSLLRSKVCSAVYGRYSFSEDEVFITEGIANALSIVLDLFRDNTKIGVLSPTYPVYKSLISSTRKEYVEVEASDNLIFDPPEESLDAIILCSPNNPTGIAFSKLSLQKWVNWANKTNTLILFDGAYESFIFEEGFPKTIYEVEGAKDCAIELRSFSKSLGFSGMRLGYFVCPKEIRNRETLTKCTTLITSKTNGVSYLTQQGGIAALSPEGLREMDKLSAHYMKMTTKLKEFLLRNKETVVGGEHAPYLFWKVEGSSREKFKELLFQKHIITVPGEGFGRDGYLRLSGFLNEDTLGRACSALGNLALV